MKLGGAQAGHFFALRNSFTTCSGMLEKRGKYQRDHGKFSYSVRIKFSLFSWNFVFSLYFCHISSQVSPVGMLLFSGGVFMLSRYFLDCSVGVWVFVTGLSQIFSFFSVLVEIKCCMYYAVTCWVKCRQRINKILLIESAE